MRLLPVPGDFAGAWVQVVPPHIVVNAAVAMTPRVLTLQEADHTCCELTEELDDKYECDDGNGYSTYKKVEKAEYTR